MKQKARLTIDMDREDHMYLKMACAKIGVSMKDFLLKLALEKIEELEDEWLAQKAEKTLEDIKAGRDELIPWEEAKKLAGWDIAK